jgi:DNA-binding PadR family transcriptional regulator
MGAYVTSSVLDLFILSLLERGLQTPYDLHQQGGLSLGSTVPALRRLETEGLVRKKAPVGSSKRPRHWFQLTVAGRKLALSGWIPLLKASPPEDFDAVLRLADIAQHRRAQSADVLAFLQKAVSMRRLSARSITSAPHEKSEAFELVAICEAWDAARLRAEAKFLEELMKSLAQKRS